MSRRFVVRVIGPTGLEKFLHVTHVHNADDVIYADVITYRFAEAYDETRATGFDTSDAANEMADVYRARLGNQVVTVNVIDANDPEWRDDE